MQPLKEIIEVLKQLDVSEDVRPKWQYQSVNGSWIEANNQGVAHALSCVASSIQIRIEPKPKLRPIRPEELPYIFSVRKNDHSSQMPWYRYNADAYSMVLWINGSYAYTTDGKEWKSFEVVDEEGK